MLHTRLRTKIKDPYVCIWCRREIDIEAPYRTPLEPSGMFRHVGVHVCGPTCPMKPSNALCYHKDTRP